MNATNTLTPLNTAFELILLREDIAQKVHAQKLLTTVIRLGELKMRDWKRRGRTAGLGNAGTDWLWKADQA